MYHKHIVFLFQSRGARAVFQLYPENSAQVSVPLGLEINLIFIFTTFLNAVNFASGIEINKL